MTAASGTWHRKLSGNLTTATAAERFGMYYWLNGWFVRRFDFNEATAWETDYRPRRWAATRMRGPTRSISPSMSATARRTFTFDNVNHNDKWLTSANDCDTSWGDNDNEWLALTSCQVLSGSGLGSMAQCMNRQHLILGFVSNADAHNNWWRRRGSPLWPLHALWLQHDAVLVQRLRHCTARAHHRV